MSIVAFPHSNEQEVRALARALRALRAISDPAAKLIAITTAAADLADDADARDQLSDTAINVHGLPADDVQAAISRGVNNGLDRRAEQWSGPRREPPRPLMREMPPADPFPVDTLGGLAAAARAIHERTQAPLATCGQSVLAAATLAVQGLADVELPTRQVRPVSCFFVTIAATGERKSAVDSEALRPIRRQESDLREEYADSLPGYQNDLCAWETAREQAKKKLGKDRAALKAALDELGTKPTAPWLPALTVQEPTYEGLVKLLAMSRPSMGIFSAEGGQFVGGHGMQDDAKLRTAAGLSDLWDGSPIKRVRADGSMILPDRRLSAHLMMQPNVAGGWLSDPLLTDQGLLSRVLVSAPDSTAGTRFWKEWAGSGDLAEYDRRIFDLVRQPLPIDEAGGGVRPRVLTFSPAARRAWIEFYNNVEARVRPGGEYDAIRGLGNKLAEHAARLAAILTVAADPNASTIEADVMDCGAQLARHYAAEALRLFQGAADDPDLRLAKQTLAWLRSRGESMVCAVDMYKFGPAGIREKATATKIVGVLVDHGYLEQVPGGAEIGGKWRRDVWRMLLDG